MSTPGWTILRRSTVFSGGPIQELAVEHVRLPDGREIADYFQIRMADFALVFATTTEGQVLTLQQYKHGLGRECLMFPGGALMPGEAPIAAARRELVEETGCVSDRWIDYGRYVTNGNQHCNTAHLFRADDCRRVSAPTAPDLERPQLLLFSEQELLQPAQFRQFGLASHAALLAIATHPALRAETGTPI